jgi:hypothetical protein
MLLPPGIDHGDRYPRGRISHQGEQALVLTRDEGWRGLQVLLDAMESVKREVKDVKLIAVSGIHLIDCNEDA